MRIWTIVGLTSSWTAFKGIGTIIGAAWATYDAFVNGQKYSILAMPLLHAFAVWNVLERLGQDEIVQDLLVGTVLILTGLLMTLLASKTELAWNWKIFTWEDETEYYGWIDRVGQLAIAYFLIGITWAIGEAEIDGMLWSIWAVFLSGVAIQGFRDETETPWRRGIGSLGCIFALFMLSLTFENELFTYVTWMFLGVVALGFGFAYISRMGETSTLFDQGYTDVKEAIYQQPENGGEYLSIPEPVLEESDEEEEDEVELLEEEVVNDASIIDKEIKAVKQEFVLPHSNYIESYDLQLDKSVLNAIQSSLATTPHAGFKPIVSIAKNGSITIDFVAM